MTDGERAEGEELRARWKELVEAYWATTKRRPRVKADCDAAYARAWQAWRLYASWHAERGLSYDLS